MLHLPTQLAVERLANPQPGDPPPTSLTGLLDAYRDPHVRAARAQLEAAFPPEPAWRAAAAPPAEAD